MIVFDNDDCGYLEWVKENRCGYVINCSTTVVRNLSIHRVDCATISSRKKTTLTTHHHIRACSNDIQELMKWAKEVYGYAPLPCLICNPQLY